MCHLDDIQLDFATSRTQACDWPQRCGCEVISDISSGHLLYIPSASNVKGSGVAMIPAILCPRSPNAVEPPSSHRANWRGQRSWNASRTWSASDQNSASPPCYLGIGLMPLSARIMLHYHTSGAGLSTKTPRAVITKCRHGAEVHTIHPVSEIVCSTAFSNT